MDTPQLVDLLAFAQATVTQAGDYADALDPDRNGKGVPKGMLPVVQKLDAIMTTAGNLRRYITAMQESTDR